MRPVFSVSPNACAIAAAAAILAMTPRDALALSCTIITTADTTFSTYNVFDPLDSLTTGTVTLHCTSVLGTDNITIGLSTGDAASYAPRQLSGPGGRTLNYNLYTNALRTLVWGDGTSGTHLYGPSNPPDDTDVPLSVYGKIPAEQSVPSGSYTDTVVVTVSF